MFVWESFYSPSVFCSEDQHKKKEKFGQVIIYIEISAAYENTKSTC